MNRNNTDLLAHRRDQNKDLCIAGDWDDREIESIESWPQRWGWERKSRISNEEKAFDFVWLLATHNRVPLFIPFSDVCIHHSITTEEIEDKEYWTGMCTVIRFWLSFAWFLCRIRCLYSSERLCLYLCLYTIYSTFCKNVSTKFRYRSVRCLWGSQIES